MSTPFARGPLLILLGALCFSTTGTVQALSPEGATPYVIGALRMLVGGLALLLWCAFRGELPRFWRWPMRCVVPSTLALLGFQFFFFRGVLEAGVAVGTVVAIGFSPIVVALLGLIFLREKPAKAWYPATGLALIGLILLNADAVGGASFAGMAFPLLAGFSYACYFVFSKPLAQNAAPGSVMMVLCLLSGLCMLPVFWIYPAAWLATPVGALVALHLGVVTTAIAFSLTLAGLKVTPAATASTLSLAEPLSAACLGISFSMNRCPCPPPWGSPSSSAASSSSWPARPDSLPVRAPRGSVRKADEPPFAGARGGPHGGVALIPICRGMGCPMPRARPGQVHAAYPGALKRSSPTPTGKAPRPLARAPRRASLTARSVFSIVSHVERPSLTVCRDGTRHGSTYPPARGAQGRARTP